MKLAELEKKYKELDKEIERLKKQKENKQIGFKDDKIFLLSINEYNRYKDKIPNAPWWWLRSPSCNQDYASCAFISLTGTVDYLGNSVNYDYNCVRPALKHMSAKEKLEWLGATWIKIDEDLYIAEMPIAMRRFDTESNNYETSEVRQFLLDWYNERLGEEATD